MSGSHGELIFFYGEGCSHCAKMHPIIDELESKEGVNILRLEVWNNATNNKKLTDMDTVSCGGVPFCINTKNGRTICGEAEYEDIKSWATEE